MTAGTDAQILADGPRIYADPSKNYGIAIVANDKVLHWLLPFLESYRATNAHIPLYLIPYDENHGKTRKIAELYGATFSDIDCGELDALSKRLYPFSLGKRHRLRKLLSLALPLDEVIHLDCDIILFRDLRYMLGLLIPGEVEFIVIAKTLDYVYNKRHLEYDYLRGAPLFNDGFFVTSSKFLSVQDFYDAMEEDKDVFQKVRQRGGLYAQPLTNFVTHRKRLKIKAAFEYVIGASGESYHKAEGVTLTQNGPLDHEGNDIYFCHWPGVTGVPRGGVFDGVWQDYADRARLRVAEAGLGL